MKTQTIILATSITAIALVSAFLGAMVLIHPASAAADSPSLNGPPNSRAAPPWMGPGGNFSATFTGGRGPPSGFNGGFGAPFQGGGFSHFQGPAANLSIGQTITLTSTAGEYRVVNAANENGTASGTLSFSVTGKLAEGYTLSLTGGTISVNGAQYTVSSGSAQMGRGANSLEGQGETSSSGQFIVSAQASGSFAGTSARASIDLSAGGAEYLINLSTTVQS